MRRSWGLFERAAASPGMVSALLRSYHQIDVTGLLSALRVPTLVVHRRDDTAVPALAPERASEVAPNAAVRRPGDRAVLRLARHAPGAMRLASRAVRRRTARELPA
jgi:pimeloyl-ACP methyl ester carboxylesterase